MLRVKRQRGRKNQKRRNEKRTVHGLHYMPSGKERRVFASGKETLSSFARRDSRRRRSPHALWWLLVYRLRGFSFFSFFTAGFLTAGFFAAGFFAAGFATFAGLIAAFGS